MRGLVYVAVCFAVLTMSAASAAQEPLRLANIVPDKMVADDGLVLAMIGTPLCGASARFKPVFPSVALPASVKKVYLDRPSNADELKYYPTPLFILFRDGKAIDVHSGVVSPRNSFAPSANAQIFQMLMVRNGIAPGTEWELAANKLAPAAGHDYQALKFSVAQAQSFVRQSFKRTLFTEIKLPDADFEGASFDHTVMAHVDLTGAKLTDAQARAIIWINSVCPDGTRSSAHGDTCVGHTAVKRTTPAPQ